MSEMFAHIGLGFHMSLRRLPLSANSVMIRMSPVVVQAPSACRQCDDQNVTWCYAGSFCLQSVMLRMSPVVMQVPSAWRRSDDQDVTCCCAGSLCLETVWWSGCHLLLCRFPLPGAGLMIRMSPVVKQAPSVCRQCDDQDVKFFCVGQLCLRAAWKQGIHLLLCTHWLPHSLDVTCRCAG